MGPPFRRLVLDPLAVYSSRTVNSYKYCKIHFYPLNEYYGVVYLDGYKGLRSLFLEGLCFREFVPVKGDLCPSISASSDSKETAKK